MRPGEAHASRDYRLACLVARRYGCRVTEWGGEGDLIVDTFTVRKPDGSPIKERIVGLLEGGIGAGVLKGYVGDRTREGVMAWLVRRGYKVLAD